MLKSREIEILRLLLKNISQVKEICISLNLKKRSLYYYLRSINVRFEREELSKLQIKNDKLQFEKDAVRIVLKSYKNEGNFSKADLEDLVNMYALFSMDGLNISKLSREAAVSRGTIKGIVQKFPYEYRDGKILNISINDRANILNGILNNARIKKFREKVMDIALIQSIHSFIIAVSKEIKLVLNDGVYESLVSYIYCYLKFDSFQDNSSVIAYEEYKIVEEIYRLYFHNDAGVNAVTDLIIGLSLIPDINIWMNEGYMLGRLIYDVSAKINIDLTRDNILYTFLLPHLKIAIYRIKNEISLHELYYAELTDTDSKLFSIVKQSVATIEKIYGITFSLAELSLLCFHFAGSIERMKRTRRKKVILVCALGYGSSKILEHRLKESFDLDIIDVLPIHMVKDDVKESGVDYILTTEELEFDAVKISPLLREEDYKLLLGLGIKPKSKKLSVDDFADDIEGAFHIEKPHFKQYLLQNYSEIFYTTRNTYFTSLLDETKIKLSDGVESMEGCIREAGGILVENKACTPRYVESMLDNFRRFTSYIIVEDGIAIPHTNLKTESFRTDFAILVLRNYVHYENKRVKIFFTYSSINNTEHLSFLKEFYNLILNENLVSDLSCKKSAKEVVEYLRAV